MPKCSDCGFSEIEKGLDWDPVKLKSIIPEIVAVKCLADPKNQKRFSDPFANRKCKDFLQRLPNYSLREHHMLKDTNTANRRFKISIAFNSLTFGIALITLVFAILVPFFTPPQPEVDLAFQFFPGNFTAPADYRISNSFTLYNQGSKICFIQRATIYEVFENGSFQDITQIYEARKTSINPGETKDFNFEIYNLSGGNFTKQYQIWVLYEPNNYVASPPIWVEWF